MPLLILKYLFENLFSNELFLLGYSVEIRVQVAVDRLAHQAHPEADQVPHAAGGHPQVLGQGRPRRGGQGPGAGLPGHDRGPQPGQRHDGHRQASGVRGKNNIIEKYLVTCSIFF